MRYHLIVFLAFLLLVTGCTAGSPSASAPQTAGADAPVSNDVSQPADEELAAQDTPAPASTPEPTPESTPEPTPTSTPVTDAILSAGAFDGFFDSAVFIGDSVTYGFQSYCVAKRLETPGFFGSASFLAAASYSISTALFNTPNADYLRFRGYGVSITQGIQMTEAKWVYLLLGVNDMAGNYHESNVEKYGALIDLISEFCPDVKIVVQSLTPVTRDFCKLRVVNITEWNAFNDDLAAMCAEKGVYFVDIATSLMDEEGYLPSELSSDQMFHLSPAAMDLWALSLRNFAMEQMGIGDATYIPVWPTATPESAPDAAATNQP